MRIIVPAGSLQHETLVAMIEEFVTRRGAIHGHTDVPLAQQVASVERQLKDGRAVILFDEGDDSFTIARAEDVAKASGEGNCADPS